MRIAWNVNMVDNGKGKIVSIATVLLIAIIFVSTTVGTLVYFNGIVNERISRISLLNSEIANVTLHISNLKADIANISVAHLVEQVSEKETSWLEMYEEFGWGAGPPTNYVQINGTVTNNGKGVALNAGLNIIGYDANGQLTVNVTVPLADGTNVFGLSDIYFGSDNATDYYANSSLKLGSLESGKTAIVNLNILHEGTIYNWTVTPVWTNTP